MEALVFFVTKKKSTTMTGFKDKNSYLTSMYTYNSNTIDVTSKKKASNSCIINQRLRKLLSFFLSLSFVSFIP